MYGAGLSGRSFASLTVLEDISKTAYLQMKKEAKERPDKPAPYILWREDVSFEYGY
jgi:hypothetical protein